MAKFTCRNCGRQTEESFLYHSPGCHKEYTQKRRDAKAAMLAAGFSQHSDAKNVFIRAGVSLSIDQVVHDVSKIEELHALAVEQAANAEALLPQLPDATVATPGSGEPGEVLPTADQPTDGSGDSGVIVELHDPLHDSVYTDGIKQEQEIEAGSDA